MSSYKTDFSSCMVMLGLANPVTFICVNLFYSCTHHYLILVKQLKMILGPLYASFLPLRMCITTVTITTTTD